MDSERDRGSEPQTRSFMLGFEKGMPSCEWAFIVPKEISWKGLLPDLNIAQWPYLIGL